MAETAATQLTRIVSLVAELSRAEREGREPATLAQLGKEYDVPPAEITRDLRALTLLGDHAEAEWLLSLQVWQQDERVSVSSAGPFRRPLRLSPDEMMAVRVALAMDPDGPEILEKLETFGRAAPSCRKDERDEPDAETLVYRATRECLVLELLYTGEGERTAQKWLIHSHQLVGWRGRTYIVAWCPAVSAWRHFRIDRIIEAEVLEQAFERQTNFQPVVDPADLFRASDAGWEPVRVRYSAASALWARERYAECEELPDGSVAVTLRASSPEWLVRRVLEQGENAEVVSPERYREAVRQAVV